MASTPSTQLRTLFVRGIPRSFDDDAFRALFSGMEGVIKSFLILDQRSGKTGHKGIGFVEFRSTKNANIALEKLNGRRVGDRELKIEFAKGRETFSNRKKRKLMTTADPQEKSEKLKEEENPFESLGVHAKVRSVAVGGLNSDLLQQVKKKAKAAGKVEAVIFPAPSSLCTSAHLYRDGCPQEVAILTFHSVATAVKAVTQLHDVTLKTETGMEVCLWCRQLSGEGAYVKRNKVIIRNLPFQVNSKELHKLLSLSGYVWKLDIPANKGFAFAYFTTRAHAQNAIAHANGQILCGRTIAVDWAVSKKQFNQKDAEPVVGAIDSDADQRVEGILKSMSGINTEEQLTRFDNKAELDNDEGDAEEHEDSIADTSQTEKASSVPDMPDEGKRQDCIERETSLHSRQQQSDRQKKETDRKEQEDFSRTVFVSGLAIDVTEDTLRSYMEQFGPLKSVFIVKNKATGKSKGTAFVKYVNEEDKKRALETLDNSKKDKAKTLPSSFGLSFTVKQAMSRLDIKTVVTKRKQEKQKADRRNLYLLQEGSIEEGSLAWNELSRTDQAIRKRSIQLKREKLKNPLFFVSATRLCIRNLPSTMTEAALERLVIESIRKRATSAQPIVRQVKLLYDDSPKGKSLRRGFVELDLHEHAMCALRQMNANPDIFGPHRRPIVEFAVDNREITNKREEQIQKLKQKALEEGRVITDATFGFGKKKRKGKSERQREKLKKAKVETSVDRTRDKKQHQTSHILHHPTSFSGDAGLETEKRMKQKGRPRSPKQARKSWPKHVAMMRNETASQAVGRETQDRFDTLMNAYQSQSSDHSKAKYAKWFD